MSSLDLRKKIEFTDVTLTKIEQDKATFREKLEHILSLDALKINGVELPYPLGKEDALLIKTAAEQVEQAKLIGVVSDTPESVADIFALLKDAKMPALQVSLPVSAVQIEYHCHVKPQKLTEMALSLLKKSLEYTSDVQFKALDAFRAEPAFLGALIDAIYEIGIKEIVLCDNVGNLSSDAFKAQLAAIKENSAKFELVRFGVETDNELGMAYAHILAAAECGLDLVNVTVYGKQSPNLETAHKLLASFMNPAFTIDSTKLHATVEKIRNFYKAKRSETSPFDFGVKENDVSVTLDKNASSEDVQKAAVTLGYDLSREDMVSIYDQFKRIANKKAYVGSRELEYIIANASLQVPQTYRLISYVINSGNLITPTAVVKLEKDGQQLNGLSVGDGPVDAGILAIENAIGCHYELDDYQVTAVTEGREAMGSVIVKLRAYGKLFSGSGLSTDVIGASIRAYVSAINKIAYEEK